MKKLILPVALLAMAAFIGVAMVVDCVRLAGDAWDRVDLADQELAKHETRLVKVLAGVPDQSPEVAAAIKDYAAAWDLKARHAAYDKIVVAYQSTMAGKGDASNPASRKFMDDANGAINRREIAEKQFDAEWQAYQQFANSRRGRVASQFTNVEESPQ
jgi:hypothetical protein